VTRYLTDDDVVERLRALCADRTQSSVARELGVSQPYLTDVLKGRRLPAQKLSLALGYRRVVRYLPLGEK